MVTYSHMASKVAVITLRCQYAFGVICCNNLMTAVRPHDGRSQMTAQRNSAEHNDKKNPMLYALCSMLSKQPSPSNTTGQLIAQDGGQE